ncbi:MAG TPA: heparinase II/III family protein [Bryobacteraceae bacterium]|nr:heparinase II/III family protein [Bryobacteraceae bacterium]
MAAGRLWLTALLLCGSAVQARTVPWTFRADFSHGFAGWMSYPLPQDIGFDPTLIVEQDSSGAVLVRQIASAGESNLSAGFIRPLHFLANSGTRLHLRYSAAWPSSNANLKLLLAGENGRRYEAALPATGAQDVTISGRNLQLPASDVPIEAIVLVGHASQPAKGTNNRIELRELQVDASRPAQVPLVHPSLITDPDRAQVAAEVVDPAVGLPVELGSGTSPVQVILKDGEGRTAVTRTVAAPGRYTIPLGKGAQPGLWTAILQTPEAHSEFSFLVLGSVPAHPRVLLTATRLAQLRAEPSFAALRKQVHAQAQSQTAKLKDAASAGAAIAKLPAGKTLRPSFGGELTEYFQLVEGYSNAIASNALDYALNRDTASLESAHRELLVVAHWTTWTPNRFASHGMHTYYETGIIAQRLAFAYDLIASKLSSDEKREVADAFWTKCIEPTVEEYFRYDRMPTAASNWMANSVGGALAAAIAVEGDAPGWRDREGVALAQLVAAYEHNLHGLFSGDGSENEPAGYEHFAMEGLSWGAAALRSLHIRPKGMQDMLEAFWWPDYAMARPDLVLDTGDFNGSFKSLAGFAFGAEYSGIPALRAFYDRVGTRGGTFDFLDLLCCTSVPQTPGGMPDSRVFGKRGSAVLRSGWGPNDTVISLRAGPWFNHEHHDQGSFQVATLGTRLIAEAGYANYYLDPNYAGYFTQASGHNTVLVDGDAFSQGAYDADIWKALRKHATFTDQLLSPKFDYLAADLAPAYEDHLSRYQRRYVFLAPDVLIVRDDLQAAQPHVFTWLLHAAENAGVEARGTTVRITDGDAVADVTAESGAAWEVRRALLPAQISQYLGNVLLHPGAHEERHRSVLRLSSAKSTAARFEVAMWFHGRSAAEGPLQPVSISNATGFSSAKSGAWALFRTVPGALRFHGLVADASVLAARGPEDWLAIDARSVRSGGEALFTASAAADASWSRSPAGIALDVHLSAPAVMTMRANGVVAGVSVDGAAVRYSEQNGLVKLPSLPNGEHRVRISTRAAL